MPLLHPSGGLLYHLRARRFAENRWQPFRESLAGWLCGWESSSAGLLIVGPSGGYTLPLKWLENFPHLVAVDFDPLAEAMFRHRHRNCQLAQWICRDVFPIRKEGIELEPLRSTLEQFPDHAVLFSNVLGQISLSAKSDKDLKGIEIGFQELRGLLVGRAWASYHDRLSATVCPELPKDKRHRNDLELAQIAFPQGGEIDSYSTALFADGRDCETFAWECYPGRWHLIEGCRNSP